MSTYTEHDSLEGILRFALQPFGRLKGSPTKKRIIGMSESPFTQIKQKGSVADPLPSLDA